MAVYYCIQCGSEGDLDASACASCGSSRALSDRARAAGVAFLLNELEAGAFDALIVGDGRSRARSHYASELARLTGRGRRASAPATRKAETPVASVNVLVGRPEAHRPVTAPRPAAMPREPRDWSWLAEQQANLFLFTGAFLTVVAALIYVGYSGQRVDGTLKMMLLVAYTLAFLAAGVVCLRHPRVSIAGQVFFAVGALLVPLNFIVARNILRGEDLSPTSLWLSGSIVTALFYTSVARIGLGRWYGYAAGASIASALLATTVVSDVSGEWVPALFLILAIALSIPRIAGDAAWRERVGIAWSIEADVIALLSVCVAVIIAPFAPRAEYHVSTLWFLPAAFSLFTAYAVLRVVGRGREEAGVAVAAGVAGMATTCVYALQLPSEIYTIAIAALAPIFGAAMLALDDERTDALVPTSFVEVLRGAAIAATGVATIVGLVFALTTLRAGGGTLDTRWFLLPSFAMVLAFWAIDDFVWRERDGALGSALALVGLCVSLVFGLHPSREYYAFSFIGGGAILLLFTRFGIPALPSHLRRHDIHQSVAWSALGAVVFGVAVAVIAVWETANPHSGYAVQTPWVLFPAFSAAAATFAIDVTMPPLGDRGQARELAGTCGLALAVIGAATAVVYALDVSAEYYSFAFIVSSIALALATRVRLSNHVRGLLPQGCVDWVIAVGRLATVVGVAAGLGCVVAAARPDALYAPDARAFLAVVMLAAGVFSVLDAMRARRVGPSLAVVASIAGFFVAVPYAVDAGVAWYGLALVAAGLLLGFGGRAWTPGWIDERVRDAAAALTVTAGWLPFAAVYPDHGRIGAAVHLGAALFYAVAACVDRSKLSLEGLLEGRSAPPVRVSAGWLYPAGLTATIGYLYALNEIPGPDTADEFAGLPILALGVGFAVLAASSRYWRSEFRPHLYVISLLLAIFSLVVPGTDLVFASMLTVYVALYALAAAWEDAPPLAASAAAFGLMAVPAWRVEAGLDTWAIVAAFTSVACALSVVSIGMRARNRRWAGMLGAGGAIYAVASPAVGLGMLVATTHHGRVDGIPFERTALYAWSAFALAVTGALAIAAALIERRRWVVAPSSAVLCVALLLAIGRFHPGNAQAYTLVIGVYLVLFGLLALWKFRLVPGITELAPYIEALGAAIVVGPSFVQSFPGAWQYEMVVVVEAALFLVGGVTLRRRALVGAGMLSLVLVAGRSLFDAVNALPNWVVVAVAGMSLLAIGTLILLGRDRWSAWQEKLLAWWGDPGDVPLTSDP